MVYVVLFLLGGVVYVLLELFWRGRSHISMAIAGGVSLVLLYGVFTHYPELPLIVKCVLGACIITAVEFIAGALVNVRMRLAVWDYSRLPYNLYGQICLRYSALWLLLCVPASVLIDYIYALFILRA